ncbi:MAG: hypothetical protein R6X25_16020 [Candidatus Krumholzibacteriia bacterium]
MTFSLTEVLLLLAVIAFVVLAMVFVAVGLRLRRAIERFEETAARVNALEPQVSRLLGQVEIEMTEVQRVTAKADHVVANVAAVSDESRRIALDLLHDLEDLKLTQRYRAAVAGARAGISVLKSAARDDR